MKKKKYGFTLLKVIFLIAAYPLVADAAMDDLEYSAVDGVYFSDPMVDCDELKNSEACETFKYTEAFSVRDGISYSDCTAECDDLFESNACFSYRSIYPCTSEPQSLMASLDSSTSSSEHTN